METRSTVGTARLTFSSGLSGGVPKAFDEFADFGFLIAFLFIIAFLSSAVILVLQVDVNFIHRFIFL